MNKPQILLHRLRDGAFALHDLVVSLSGERLGYLSVLNGVIGDMLEGRKNRYSIPMALYAGEERQPITESSLDQLDLAEGGRIAILAHGSCNSEKDWGFDHAPLTDYGSLLRDDLGFSPFYLRYNSGLHISTNGRRLAALLEDLVRRYPQRVEEIVLIGHSMGGLIFRSACYYGRRKSWVKRVKKIFYLGSPHFGTHFEKFGKLTTTLLRVIPTIPTKALAAFIELRSAGIKDLRHGYLIDQDWQEENADDLLYIHQNKIPLLETADHYLICGTLSRSADSRIGRLFGDGMVHPGSGIGKGLLPTSRIPFPEDHCKVFPGISHYKLLKSRKVYRQLKAWCLPVPGGNHPPVPDNVHSRQGSGPPSRR